MDSKKNILDTLLSYIMGGEKAEYEFTSAKEACDFLKKSKNQSMHYLMIWTVWGIGFLILVFNGVGFIMKNALNPIRMYGGMLVFILYCMLLIPLARKWIRQNRKAKACYNKMVEKAVQEVIPGAVCQPEGCISLTDLYKLGVVPEYEESGGSFLIQYERNGKKYGFSNIILRRQVMENGAAHMRETFIGQGYTAEYKAKVNGYVRIISTMKDNMGREDLRKHRPLDQANENRIDTESIVFNEHFEVYASDSETAFYVLNPFVIEQLLMMKKQLGHFGLAVRGSEIMIAFPTGHRFFQKPSTLQEIEAVSVEGIKQEAQGIVTFIQQIENAVNGRVQTPGGRS